MPIIDTAPFFIAQQKGYFKQEGLTVTPKIIKTSISAVPDMESGSVDIIGGGNYVSFFQGAANGSLKIKLVAAGDQCAKDTVDILALPKSGITKPADLVGKKVAVNIPNNIQSMTADAVLKADNVDYTKVKYVQVPFPTMESALLKGSVDAIASVQPFITSIEEKDGAVPVLDQCTGPTANFPFSGYFATQSWVKKYPKTAAAFQRAIEKAAADADGSRKVVDQILPTYTKIPAKTAAVLGLPNWPSTMDTTQLQRVADLMYTSGLLKSKFNVAPLVFHASG